MDVVKWIEAKEKQLLVQLEDINQELQTVVTVRQYLQAHYFNNDAQNLFIAYMKHIDAYCNWTKVVIDGEEKEPNEALMRRIEESIGISENAKKAFREEIIIRMSAYSRKGKRFDYNSHELLCEAIKKCL